MPYYLQHMYQRVLPLPNKSFFLFGPRATGKTTWLQAAFPNALVISLLDTETYFRLSSRPGDFADLVLATPKSQWIVLDEVQRIPELLNQVHALSEQRRFALTGSSARKLKRGKANLLAGRALVRNLFPLVRAEYGSRDLNSVLRFGTLPGVMNLPSDAERIDLLDAYVGTYLREEIKEEALTRNVPSFSRFLVIAALANAEVTNLSNIARDSMVARATVSTFFEILEDTLIGRRLPSYTPKLRIKETAHPKFYLFDTGVTRALQSRTRDSLPPEERGKLFETYVFHELLAHTSYSRVGGEWSYWRTHNGVEVDFIWRRADKVVAIEVKSKTRWEVRDDAGLLAFSELHPKAKRFGVYLGAHPLQRPFGRVLPIADLLSLLEREKLLG